MPKKTLTLLDGLRIYEKSVFDRRNKHADLRIPSYLAEFFEDNDDTPRILSDILPEIIPPCVPFFMVVCMVDNVAEYKFFLRKGGNDKVCEKAVTLIHSIRQFLIYDSKKEKKCLSLTDILFKEPVSYHPFLQIKYCNNNDTNGSKLTGGGAFDELVQVLDVKYNKDNFFYDKTIMDIECSSSDFISNIINIKKPTGEFYNITREVSESSNDKNQIKCIYNKLGKLDLSSYNNNKVARRLISALYIYKYFPWEKYMYYVPGHIGIDFPCDGIILFATEKVEIPALFNLQYKLNRLGGIKRIEEIQERTTRIAIISILVDSFAHNIAAHSLSAMVWYLKQQRQKQIDSDLPYDICKKKFSDLKKGIERSAEKQHLLDLIKEIDNNFVKIAPLEGSVQYAQYLTHKAAFWSGVTRDFECGGEIRTWYDVLKNFAENSIFLGTIAHAEGIHKVRIKVGYGEENNGSEQQTKDFAVAKFDTIEHVSGTTFMKSYKKDENKNESTPWTDLDKYKWKLFLPNGIVGQHALYTIFENTIRNIKHADPDELEKAKTEGIEFNIFIESVDNKHFNTTIWLGNKSKIMEEKKDEKGNVVKVGVDIRISKLLEEAIVTGNGTPRMGGNSQDKICASMLYNNVFSKVDVNDQDNPKPIPHWIHVKRDPENGQELGVIKRSFYVWKGANAVELIPDAADPEAVERTTSAISSEDEEKIVKIKVGELDYENPARFIFVITPKKQKSDNMSESELEKLKELAENGIVRIMEKSEDIGDHLDSLYKAWNKKWIKYDKKVYLVRGITAASSISSENKNPWVTNYHPGEVEEGIIVGSKICRFCHDENDKPPEGKAFLTRKSHCVLSTKFTYLGDKKEDRLEIRGEKIGQEFIETLLTHIEIYDNRIFDRVSSREKIELYSKQLFLYVHNEDIKNIKPYNKKNSKANFIIIHLSYIESLGFKEENINDFIHKFFVDDNSKEEFLDDNSKLVITTGRGRGEWHNSLKQYKPHVLFKPIDSLLNAVEDGLMLKDDFQVKYNLVKILFGS